jgi:hypothetical protein
LVSGVRSVCRAEVRLSAQPMFRPTLRLVSVPWLLGSPLPHVRGGARAA